MSFNAKVFRVMIISSGDVSKERDTIRSLINEWNSANAYEKKAVLLATGSDTYISPEQGKRSQEQKRGQAIKDCDLLIGVFWTKIGSSTGKSSIDTLNEIKRYIDMGRPALLYFSNAPVHMGNIVEEEYDKLMEFKDEHKGHPYARAYGSISDLQSKLRKQLSRMSMQHEKKMGAGTTKVTATSHTTTKPYTRVNKGPMKGNRPSTKGLPMRERLTDQAQRILLETDASVDGSIMKLPTLDGVLILVNRQSFVEEDKGRKVSSWEIAIEDLTAFSLIKDTGYKGEVYKITDLGRQIAGEIRKNQ
ncbi:MAG TPA: hypothetical protein VFD33_01770 [Bacillota bacterium]|nr:hypothetical protein [Bacillota bacterium]